MMIIDIFWQIASALARGLLQFLHEVDSPTSKIFQSSVGYKMTFLCCWFALTADVLANTAATMCTTTASCFWGTARMFEKFFRWCNMHLLDQWQTNIFVNPPLKSKSESDEQLCPITSPLFQQGERWALCWTVPTGKWHLVQTSFRWEHASEHSSLYGLLQIEQLY